jgi:hypothetical protein
MPFATTIALKDIKWNKLGTERQVPHDFNLYVKSKEVKFIEGKSWRLATKGQG